MPRAKSKPVLVSNKSKKVQRIKKHADVLRALPQLNVKQRKALLKLSNKKDDLCETICEISLNLLKGNVPLTKKQKDQFKTSEKNLLRKLADRSLSHTKRKKLVVQTGGFLPLLIAPILSLIGGLVGEVIGKKI